MDGLGSGVLGNSFPSWKHVVWGWCFFGQRRLLVAGVCCWGAFIGWFGKQATKETRSSVPSIPFFLGSF